MRSILEIQNIGKKFQLHHESKPYLSLREELIDLVKLKKRRISREDFWALKDVSFDVNPGDSVGIIGKNGAGKSTLLKILSKITPPTTGKIIARGRIASLLEVGTGFHPELTGRENIYLNGSILGMRKQEIATRFDQIVDFAGTEKFLDMALKHYSSGMQLRLAFAVAAFLEPEILIIDEVLAVGDAEFQKKCLGRMEDVSKSGRTVIFVSHNMAAIQNLCRKSLLLHQGSLVVMDESAAVVGRYLEMAFASSEFRNGSIEFQDNRIISKIELYCDGKRSDTAYMGCSLEIIVHFTLPEPQAYPVLGIILRDSQTTAMIGINNNHYVGNVAGKPVRRGTMSSKIGYLNLMSGLYSLDVHFGNNLTDLEVRRDCFSFVVEKMPFSPSGYLPDERINKFFIPEVTWQVTDAD